MFTWNCNKRRRMLYKMTVGVFSLQQKNTILGATIVIAHKQTRIWHNDIRPSSENINENETNKNILRNKTNFLQKSKLSWLFKEDKLFFLQTLQKNILTCNFVSTTAQNQTNLKHLILKPSLEKTLISSEMEVAPTHKLLTLLYSIIYNAIWQERHDFMAVWLYGRWSKNRDWWRGRLDIF